MSKEPGWKGELDGLLLVAGLLAAVFALAFLLAPQQMFALYGMETNAAGLWTMRLLGAAAMGYAVLALLGTRAREPAARTAIAATQMAGWGLGSLVALGGILSGQSNQLGWVTVALWGGIAGAFAARLPRLAEGAGTVASDREA